MRSDGETNIPNTVIHNYNTRSLSSLFCGVVPFCLIVCALTLRWVDLLLEILLYSALSSIYIDHGCNLFVRRIIQNLGEGTVVSNGVTVVSKGAHESKKGTPERALTFVSTSALHFSALLFSSR